MKKKIAIIGCGANASNHVLSFKKAGFDIVAVAASLNSTNVNSFAKKHNIPESWSNPIELIKQKNVDGFIVSVPADKISLLYLDLLAKKNVPTLMEKPITYEYKKLLRYRKNSKIFVAFNRRYYSSISAAKSFLKKNKFNIVQIEIPEQYRKKNKYKLYNLYYNSIHIFDLIRYLFGDLKFEKKLSLKNSIDQKGIVTLFRTKNNDIINVVCNFQASANFNIKIDSGSNRLILNPIEQAFLYKGIRVEQPNNINALKVYSPVLKKSYRITNKERFFKPGFVDQALDFKKFLFNKKPYSLAKIEDAIEALKIAEKFLN